MRQLDGAFPANSLELTLDGAIDPNSFDSFFLIGHHLESGDRFGAFSCVVNNAMCIKETKSGQACVEG